MKFIDNIFLPFPLRKLSGAFGLTTAKGWYPLNFNTQENLNYVGSILDKAYYGIDEMSVGERADFLEWYDSQRSVVFDNKHVLEAYSQDDVTVLRQACQVFRREFLDVGKIDVFQESVTIVSACNKVLRKRFLKSNTIGLIPTGGYSGNVSYSKKLRYGLCTENSWAVSK